MIYYFASLNSIIFYSWQKRKDNEVGFCSVCHGGTVWVPAPVSQPDNSNTTMYLFYSWFLYNINFIDSSKITADIYGT